MSVNGSAKFAKLIHAKAYEEAARIARKQIEDGASVIDINMDDAMLDSALELSPFVRYISNDPDIARAALFLCDERNSFINGENINIDGGMSHLMVYHDDCGWRYEGDSSGNP